MRDVIAARCPNQKYDPAAPHGKALEPRLAIALTVVFHSDHRGVENGVEFREIDSMLPNVLAALRLIPRDHGETVYAE